MSAGPGNMLTKYAQCHFNTPLACGNLHPCTFGILNLTCVRDPLISIYKLLSNVVCMCEHACVRQGIVEEGLHVIVLLTGCHDCLTGFCEPVLSASLVTLV